MIVVLTFTSVTATLTNKSHAWTGDLPDCRQYAPQTFDWSWYSRIYNHYGSNFDDNQNIDEVFANENFSVLMYATSANPSATDFNVTLVVVNDKVTITKNTLDNEVSLQTGTTNLDLIQIYGNTNGAYENTTLPNAGNGVANPTESSGTNQLSGLNPTCLSAHNVNYSSGYDQKIYSFDRSENSACSTLDIACQISSLFRNTVDTFTSVGKTLLSGIASFFIPSPQQISANFEQLTDFFVEKMGFLMYPLDFFTDLYNAFTDTSNQWCNATTCSKSFGELWGTEFTLDLYALKNSIPDYWDWIIAFIRGATTISLLLAVYRVLMRTLRGS